MKLNSLIIPDFVISGLYNKSLVTKTKDRPEEQKSQPESIPLVNNMSKPVAVPEILFLGENKKNILILVKYENVDYLPDEELSFLNTMLSACKLTVADVAIINLNKIPNPSYKGILNIVNGNILMLFGIDPAILSLPVSFPHFQVQLFNGYTFLYTPSLDAIRNDKILKSKLWVCLRRIFNV